MTLIRPSTASASPIIFKSWETEAASENSKLRERLPLCREEGNIYRQRHCFPDCIYDIHIPQSYQEKGIEVQKDVWRQTFPKKF